MVTVEEKYEYYLGLKSKFERKIEPEYRPDLKIAVISLNKFLLTVNRIVSVNRISF